jgi:hypothetical protein
MNSHQSSVISELSGFYQEEIDRSVGEYRQSRYCVVGIVQCADSDTMVENKSVTLTTQC